MSRYSDVALSLLRVVSGFVLFCAGALKMFGGFGGMPPGVHLTPLITIAGIIEVIAGPLLMLGLFTRPVAFLASGEMAFAYSIGHFPRGVLPIQNHGEAATLLCFIFLYLAAAGAGPFSLDALVRRTPLSASGRSAASESRPRP